MTETVTETVRGGPVRHGERAVSGVTALATALLTAVLLLLGTGVAAAAPATTPAVDASASAPQRCHEDLHEVPKRSECRGDRQETSPVRRCGPRRGHAGHACRATAAGTRRPVAAARALPSPRHAHPPGRRQAVLQNFRC